MRGLERFIVIWALVYTALYLPFFLVADRLLRPDQFFAVLLPLHFLGMAQNLAALVLTIRDLYKRNLPTENAKLTWLLLILTTGGIGWLVYVFKYALKPRVSAP
jgi:hypothetical protein